MAITPFANKAELRVEVGRTSVEELRAFQERAGSGDVRAKKNDDGSHTLYVAADRKPRLSSMFQSYGAEARTAKQDLAKDLIGEIVSRRMPNGAMSHKELVSNINKGGSVKDLGDLLKKIDKQSFNAIPKNIATSLSIKLDARAILKMPDLLGPLELFAEKQFAKENLDFLKAVNDFSRHKTVDQAMEAAETIFAENTLDTETTINLPSKILDPLRQHMGRLRELHASEGGITNPEDTLLLKNLFVAAADEINSMFTADTLRRFKLEDPAFERAMNKLGNAGEVARSNQSSHAMPGSGKEILDRVEQNFGQYRTLDTVLANPTARGEFLETVRGRPEETHLNNMATLEELAGQIRQAGANGVSNTEMFEVVKQFVTTAYGPGEAPVANQDGDALSLDGGDAPVELDPFFENLLSRMDTVTSQISKENDLFDGDLFADDFGDQGFDASGAGVGGADSARKMILNLVTDLIADARIGLKTKRIETFTTEKMDAATRQVSSEVALEQADQPYSVLQFLDKDSVSSGGATGSGTKRVGAQGYQEKGGFETKDSVLSKIKMGFSNAENYAELVASNIAQMMLPEADRGLSPDVVMRHNPVTHETFITSKWLEGGQGDLNDIYRDRAGLLPGSSRRIVVMLGSDAPSGNGVLNLSGPLADDMMRLIMTRAILGDHDANVGNFVIVKTDDGTLRGAGIDYGHALNDLISGTFAGMVGGGVKFEGNRILDFFNRETVSHLLPSKQQSKLWRDFDGIAPSETMAKAMRDTAAASLDGLAGVGQGKQQFDDILEELRADEGPGAEARIRDFDKSLRLIAVNIGMEKPTGTTEQVIEQVFAGIAQFIRDGGDQMNNVADLTSFQAKVNTFVAGSEDGAQIPADLRQAFETMHDKPGIGSGKGDGVITWMKQSRDTPAFSGTLDAYVQRMRL